MILYYSGTGNSRYVAQRIACTTGDALVCLGERIKAGDTSTIHAQERLVICVPTYAWRIPRIVEEHLRATAFDGQPNVWFVMTCGDNSGNAAKFAARLCASKGWQYMGTRDVVMPENYVAMFQVPSKQAGMEIVKRAEPLIDELALVILHDEKFVEHKSSVVDKFLSGVVNGPFYATCVSAHKFTASDACVGCGKCAELCVLNNIELVDGRPTWGKNCTHCMACISGCPTLAIEYGKSSLGKPRWWLE
jgi:ferredoxin